MTIRVAVAGCTGYAGGELLRLLLRHPEVEIGALTAHSSVGDKLAQHHPHLAPLANRDVAETAARTLAGHDVVFLALPHGASAGPAAPAGIVIVAASGPSGAGKGLKPHLLGTEVMGGMSPYGVGGTHRHTPEIVQNLEAVIDQPVQVSFTPLLAPMPRGILATCSAPLAGDADAVRDAYEACYADEPFVTVLPEGQWPQTAAVLGSNHVLVQATVDDQAQRVVAVSAIDNLTKGTAGGAVQSMNLALGLPEHLGLDTIGVAP